MIHDFCKNEKKSIERSCYHPAWCVGGCWSWCLGLLLRAIETTKDEFYSMNNRTPSAYIMSNDEFESDFDDGPKKKGKESSQKTSLRF
jgi:hypothetical protein